MHVVVLVALGILALVVLVAIAKKLLKLAMYGTLALVIAGGVLWLMFAGEDRKQEVADQARELAGQAAEQGKAVLKETGTKATEATGAALEEAKVVASEAKTAAGEAMGEVAGEVKAAASETKQAISNAVHETKDAAQESNKETGDE